MEHWVKLCSLHDAPAPGEVKEAEVAGIAVCLANIDGKLAALDNWCPHRRGPLGQGWIEGNAVVCPLHSWSFDSDTGLAQEPEHAKVAVFQLKKVGGDILLDIG